MIEGWYYLHVNGDLIYKQELGDTAADIRESPFALMLWPFDPGDRAGAWRILVEALAIQISGDRERARRDVRVQELADKWGCDDNDAITYEDILGVTVQRDGTYYCATGPGFTNLQESPAGFGQTHLEALADLCRNLGYQPRKTWGPTFESLIVGSEPSPTVA